MPFDRTVHHTVKTREGTMPGRVTPHILLVSAEGQMIIQAGQWYDAGGVEVDEADVPEWAWETAKTFSPAMREELGLEALTAAEEPKAGAAAKPTSLAPASSAKVVKK